MMFLAQGKTFAELFVGGAVIVCDASVDTSALCVKFNVVDYN